jgi:FeS assembly SUF system regulator
MFRLSKITDYGIVILAHLASRSVDDGPGEGAPTSIPMNARELAEQVELPVPMVSKVLKTLTRAGVLESQRGVKGGYSLAHRPDDLTVAEMVSSLEGPLALTQCNLGPHVCDLEASCSVKTPWLVINRVVQNALSSVTLADLTNPAFAAQHAPLAGLLGMPALDRSGFPGGMPELTDPAVLHGLDPFPDPDEA